MKAKFFFNGLLALAFAFMGVAMLTMLPPSDAQGQSNNKAAAPVVVDTTLPDAAADAEPPVVVDNPQPDDQSPTVIDMEWLVNKENAIASVLFLLLTFLGKWIPGLNKIGDTGKRALVVGVTVIVGFVVAKFIVGGFQWGEFLSLVITYLLTSLGYDKALKPAGIKTPSVAAA